ncbi:MAG TPA: N-acetyl-alpha-D-glucosaminyl L-malate synthase BshA [bacterium]|nr:N-acetyl-alpha-D-glucosaminyl L-malate synthase BshA [bacterium]
MNIAIVCYATSGGSGVVATELGMQLAKRGHKIHFISSEVPFRLIGPWKKNIYYHEVDTFDYPLFEEPPYDLALATKIYQVVSQNNIDVIHSHYAVPHSVSAYLAQQMALANKQNVGTITTLHGTDVSIVGDEPTLRDVVAFALSKSDVVTSVSQAMASEAEDKYSLNKKVQVIYNFVNIQPPAKTPEDLKDVFGANDSNIITHISNFRQVKRIEDVIRVFNKINKKVDSKLLLIGDGPEQRAAHKLAVKLNVSNKIHFLGLQSSIEKLLAISDLFLLPSEKENFSLSALEAMSCGVPVIATQVGGMAEMIDNGKDGYLFDVGDIDGMAEAGIKLLDDKDSYKKISAAAQKKAKEGFSPEIIVPQYEKLYESVIKNHRS